ncbi:MAG: hypothetical protein JW832_11320 [Deltaproteobacteria bacterium]|nr:hypothetical protein [Deltaproteobacteria bacterium]
MEGFRKLCALIITAATGALALAAFYLELKVRQAGVMALALVTLGTFIDFLGSYTGGFITCQARLLLFTKARFSLLNFGIIFTPLSAAFILAETPNAPLCSALAALYPGLAVFSLGTGALFLFTKYTPATEEGVATYRLDRDDPFTKRAFLIRRIILAGSLVIAILAGIDGLRSGMAVWTSLFCLLFIATVPLHILHKHVCSMAAEAVTLAVLFYGAVQVFAK